MPERKDQKNTLTDIAELQGDPGRAKKTGLAKLHKGEVVLTKKKALVLKAKTPQEKEAAKKQIGKGAHLINRANGSVWALAAGDDFFLRY